MEESVHHDIVSTPLSNEHQLWAALGGLDANRPLSPSTFRTAPAPTTANPSDAVRQPGLPQEMRALWVTRWDYRRPDDIRVIADRAAQANFNTLLFQVRGNADAFYRSQLEPWAARLSNVLGQDPGWDPLQLAVDEAHARGLELHAWINVYPAWLGETPPTTTIPEPMFQRFNRLYGDAWVMWGRDRQPMALNENYLWANPAHWAVVEHITAVCADIVSRYYVDGIHLDNVRYASWQYSQDPLTKDRLAQAQAVEPGLDQREWQRRQVSHLVRELHTAINDLKPGLLLSAAVWPIYQDTWEWWSQGDGHSGYCQDSVGWLQAEIVDAICPMLYLGSTKTDDGQFEALVRDFVARSGSYPVYAGIACTYDAFEPIGRRIDLARQAGVTGQALFAYGHVASHNYWDEFLAGPYASPAIVLPPESVRKRVSSRLQQRR